MVIVAVLAVGPAIYLVREQYFARMATLANPEQEASAASRLLQASAALKIWSDYPVLGVGFGSRNYGAMVGDYLGSTDTHGAHNTYIQMAVDSGTGAFVVYVCLLFGTIRWLGRSAVQTRRTNAGLEYIPIALQTALVTFAVGGYFGSMQRYDFVYFLLMAAAAWYGVKQDLDASQVGADQDGAAHFPLVDAPAVQL